MFASFPYVLQIYLIYGCYFYILGLDSCLLQVYHILNHQKSTSCFCVVIRLNLFKIEFWFSFVCVLCIRFGYQLMLGSCVLFVLLQFVYARALLKVETPFI